jgi:hypothetical protein
MLWDEMMRITLFVAYMFVDVITLIYMVRARRLFMLQTCRIVPAPKTAKAVYAARPLLMIPTPRSLFLLILTSIWSGNGRQSWSHLCRIPQFHVACRVRSPSGETAFTGDRRDLKQ